MLNQIPKGRHIATAAGLAGILIAIALAWFLLPAREWLEALIGWIRFHGAWGVLAFALAYVIVVVALAPAEIMSIAAGLIFGAWGFPLAWISTDRNWA